MEKKKVAWIGTGVMGSQQAGHLAKHGYTVSAYTHRYEKLLELQQQFGIIPCKTIAEAVQDADYIFVMVGYPSDVKEVFCDRGGIFDSAKPGALAIDMTTSSPSLAQQLYEQGPGAFPPWMLLCPAATAAHATPPFPSWSAATRQTLPKRCRCSSAWAKTSSSWVLPAADSTQRLPTRLP